MKFDLTASAEIRPEASDNRPFEMLALIDRAIAAAEEAAHACCGAGTREYFEFALALLRESWIAQSGQNARNAEKVIADVQWGLRLIAAVFDKKEGR